MNVSPLSDHPVAVSGTRRAIRELVDGTIRVQIDIDPRFAKDFHHLFPEIDMPVALAPLFPDVKAEPSKESGSNWKNLGPLAQSAIMVCKEPAFLRFVAGQIGLDPHHHERATEEEAAEYIRSRCGVSSRKELDSLDGGREKLGALMSEYREWQGG